MTNTDNLKALMSKQQIHITALGQVYSANLSLFNSAALIENGKLMDKYRGEIHNIVDNILDANSHLFSLTRQIMDDINKNGA